MKRLKHYFLTVIIGFLSGLIACLLTLQFYPNLVGKSPTTTITQTETSTTQAVKVIQNAVVSVTNYQQNFNGELAVAGEGSGVIYRKEGNFAYLVTNNHVIEGAQQLEILLSNGTKAIGELIGSDVYSDLAVVRIDAQAVDTIATFADSDTINVGEPAIAIGSPLGSQYANSVTEGIVSSLSRTVTSENEAGQAISTNAIQTDAAINPGNSGGPLINIKGQIIGINSSKIASSGRSMAGVGISVEGMSFAIPSNDVVAIINQLETNGKVIRPAIGITMANLSNVSTHSLAQLNLPSDLISGILVISVQDNMPAAGILENSDIITEIDGEAVTAISDLQSILYKHHIGDTITVTYYRQGEKRTALIELSKTTEDLSQ